MKRTLSAENIDSASMEIEKFLQSNKTDRKEIIKIKLGAEEALLRFSERFGEETVFNLKTGRSWGRTKIDLSVPGESYDPFSDQDHEDETSALMRSMLTTLDQRPIWSYTFKTNTISFITSKRTIPEWSKIVIAMVLAVVCGLLVRSFPDSLKTFIQNDLFSPLLETFLGFLNAVSGPMIFLAVVWGIYSMGDVTTFSRIGKKLTLRFVVYIVLLTTLTGLIALLFFNLNFGEGNLGSGFSAIFTMVLDIVPDNLFTPFSRGNTLQILFVAIIIGITMIILGNKARHIAVLSEQLNLVVQGIMGVISKLVPFYIFGSLFNIVLTSDFSVLSLAGKIFFGVIVASVFDMLIQSIVTSIKLKLSPFIIWKRSFRTMIIALTTASSSAAFASNIDTCKKEYGVDEKLTNFAVPFAQVLYKPGVCGLFFISVLGMAESHQITVSVIWIITALFVCMILSAATPPIPGGTLASFSVIFAQLGISTEHLAVILALNVLLDFFNTASDVFCGQLMIVDEAQRYREN